ncbi:hypothetical protein WJX74_004152 [Apatococcus lobatus]|uniref:Uncharacterized protein n=1 Tax=Apatococcus lobatus TaxID=904363 RepID=A0AAW1Q8L3_9CHLO
MITPWTRHASALRSLVRAVPARRSLKDLLLKAYVLELEWQALRILRLPKCRVLIAFVAYQLQAYSLPEIRFKQPFPNSIQPDMVRESLKEPFKSKAKLREAVYFKSALWKDGQQQQQVITDLTPPEAIEKK